ncbi:MAG: oligosaccharide flippase family protein [Acetobacteraceae bacterium]|nr:oligosaccharide flippase family protein [Acetobacteraceae bacterium]
MTGMVFLLAQDVVGRACVFVSQLLLAMLLRPADFGLIGLTYTVTNIAWTLTNIGLEEVLLRRRGALTLWSGPAMWMSVGPALIAGILVVAVSPLAAAVYDVPQLTGLLAVAALSIPLGALSIVPGMLLRAQMRFRTTALYGAAESVVQSSLTVFLAWSGFGAYSFLLPMPLLAAAKAVVWWYLTSGGIRLAPRPTRWRYLVGDTTYAFATRVTIAMIGQGATFMLGLLAKDATVGIYYFGFRFAAQPLLMLAGNLSAVLYPVLAQYKSDPDRQSQAALKACKLVFSCLFPLACLQAAAAAPVVSLFFGGTWSASIPVIQLLSVGLAFDSVSWTSSTLMWAVGEFRSLFLYSLVEIPIFFALVLTGSLLGQASGTAAGVSLFYVTKIAFVYLAFKKTGVSARRVASIYVKPFLASAFSAGASWAISLLPPFSARPVAQLLLVGLLGLMLYLGLIRWLAPEIWMDLRERFCAKWAQVAARQSLRITPQEATRV